MHKNDYRPPDRSRKQRFLTQDEIEKGKKARWTELEITGFSLKILEKKYSEVFFVYEKCGLLLKKNGTS